jgi:hypothetical protein
MLLGNAGIITAISSLILTFINGQSRSLSLKLVILFAGLILLWGLAVSPWVDRHVCDLINWALRRYTRLEIQDFVSLLKLSGDYGVRDLKVEPHGWLSNKKLGELQLRDEGIVVLGITREGGEYIGAPNGSSKILPGDKMILYGRSSALEQLDERRAGAQGDAEHDQASAEQREVVRDEKSQDPAENKA